MLLSALAAAALVAAAPAPHAQEASPAEPPAPDLLLVPNDELARRLAAIAASRPDLAQLLRLGASRAGTPIEAVRLAAPGGGPRPALLLVAGLDGTRVFDSGVALEHAERLAAGYGTDEAVTALLDRATVYVVPRVDPDGAASRFTTPLFERRGAGHDFDEDHDGRRGEDPTADVNGDGLITDMRVPDPEGEWKEDPCDPRALVRADRAKGERGTWKRFTEGRDLDGDERAAEDAAGDALVERNFPAGWEEHTPRAGLFPTDEPGARALADFVLEHTDVALVLTYGALDDLAAKPKAIPDDAPAQDRVPAAGLLQSDADLLAGIAETYTELTGIEERTSDDDAGTFERWCYEHRGLWTLSAELWEMPLEPRESEDAEEDAAAGAEESAAEEGAGPPEARGKEKAAKEPEPSDDAKRLSWIDSLGEGPDGRGRFVPWTPFEHPELGPVEIGGFRPFALSEPPADERRAIADAELAFLLHLGTRLPRAEVASFRGTELGAGLWRVEAAIVNEGLLPLFSKSAERTRTLRPARLRLVLPDGAELLAGEAEVLVDDLPGTGGRHEETWLVRGAAPPNIGLELVTDHAGAVRVEAEVAR